MEIFYILGSIFFGLGILVMSVFLVMFLSVAAKMRSSINSINSRVENIGRMGLLTKAFFLKFILRILK